MKLGHVRPGHPGVAEDVVEPAHGAFGLGRQVAGVLGLAGAVHVELAADVDGARARDGAADVDRDRHPIAVIETNEASRHRRPLFLYASSSHGSSRQSQFCLMDSRFRGNDG